MQSISGRWVLHHEACDSQKPLMRAMGRPEWQIHLVDGAQEVFLLLLCSGGDVVKKVHIYLQSRLLQALKHTLRMDYTEVHYDHTLTADGGVELHQDDEKRFGECTSTTVLDGSTLTITWCTKHGDLRVDHRLNEQGLLEARMTFTNRQTGKAVTATKRYKREPLQPDDWKVVSAVRKRNQSVTWKHH